MKKWFLIPVVVLTMVLLAACGGATEESTTEKPAPTGDEQIVEISATNFDFNQDTYEVEAGKPIKVSFKSEQGVHGIAISGTDISLNDGDSEVVTLKPGEYNIICSIPCGTGHSEMQAKLVVT